MFRAREKLNLLTATTEPVIERAYKNILKTKLNEVHRGDNWNL